MAFPASQQTLEDGLRLSRIVANRVQRRIERVRNDSAAGNIPRLNVIQVISVLSDAINDWAAISALPGIAQYARDQFDDQGLDIIVEFVAMRNAAISLRDWTFSNFPTDGGSGAWLVSSYDVQGNETPLEFTTLALVEFRTRADALLATIS